jgi:hypothetical protein
MGGIPSITNAKKRSEAAARESKRRYREVELTHAKHAATMTASIPQCVLNEDERPAVSAPEAGALRLAISVPEAGGLLGLGRNASYEAAKRGELPTVNFGRRLVVPLAALRRILEQAGQ